MHRGNRRLEGRDGMAPGCTPHISWEHAPCSLLKVHVICANGKSTKETEFCPDHVMCMQELAHITPRHTPRHTTPRNPYPTRLTLVLMGDVTLLPGEPSRPLSSGDNLSTPRFSLNLRFNNRFQNLLGELVRTNCSLQQGQIHCRKQGLGSRTKNAGLQTLND